MKSNTKYNYYITEINSRHFYKIIVLVIFIFLTVSQFGCGQKSFYLKENYNKVHKKVDTSACNFRLISITDNRKNKNSLGEMAGRKIFHEKLKDWITNGFLSIGIKTVGDDENQPIIGLEVELEHVYGRSVATSITCNVVFKVRYSYESKYLDEKTYRGTKVAVNWTSGDGEIKNCFDNALKDALEQVLKDSNTFSRVFNAQISQ